MKEIRNERETVHNAQYKIQLYNELCFREWDKSQVSHWVQVSLKINLKEAFPWLPETKYILL